MIPRVQQDIRQQLRDSRSQLLRAAYYEMMRDQAQVENHLAEADLQERRAVAIGFASSIFPGYPLYPLSSFGLVATRGVNQQIVPLRPHDNLCFRAGEINQNLQV